MNPLDAAKSRHPADSRSSAGLGSVPLAAQITPICMIACLSELDRTPIPNGGWARARPWSGSATVSDQATGEHHRGEVARVLRPGGRAVITTWERRGSGPPDLPAPYSIADGGALAEAAGLRVLVREERDDWLEQERAFYQRVIAEDREHAEPALRLPAGEARDLLPHSASVRRLLLVETI